MSDRFVNPYNFIPVVGKKRKAYETSLGEKLYTGAITYSLTTKTPLIIPATNNQNAFTKNSKGDNLVGKNEHKSYDFYSYNDSVEGEKKDKTYEEPVIPGSEIRGMLRSVYETLTDSCMSILNEDPIIAKRTAEIFKAGLLKIENNGITLYEAENVIYRPERDFTKKYYSIEMRPEGAKVYFDLKSAKRINRDTGRVITPLTSKISDQVKGSLNQEGYLIKGVKGPDNSNKEKEKHNCHIFFLKNNAKVKGVFSSADKDALLSVISSYQSQDEHKDDYEEYRKCFMSFYTKGVEGDCFPVYYSEISDCMNNGNKIIYYSPAAITKELATHTVSDRAGDWLPCKNKDSLCPACNLFGMVGEKGSAKASSVRVADAYLKRQMEDFSKLYEEVTTLQALNSPKISNSEFYLKKPTKNATFWTYDYYIEDGKIHFYKPDEIIIRGRKFYWHQPEMEIRCFEPDNMNVTVRPLKKGVKFTGKVFFESITKKQLDQLIFIINGGENSRFDYKMGMAKPLGYGSVHTEVDNVELRCIVNVANGLEYVEEPYESHKLYEDNEFSATVKEAFELMMTFDTLKGLEVTYPLTIGQQPGEEGFKWFTEQNHCKLDRDGISRISGMRNNRKQEVLDRSLPEVKKDRDFTLPKQLRKGSGPNRGNNNGNTNNSSSNKPNSTNTSGYCHHPGCKNKTDINPKTGKHYGFCSEHAPKMNGRNNANKSNNKKY